MHLSAIFSAKFRCFARLCQDGFVVVVVVLVVLVAVVDVMFFFCSTITIQVTFFYKICIYLSEIFKS